MAANDHAAVQPTRKEGTDRHIGNQAFAHRLEEQLPPLLHRFIRWQSGISRLREPPLYLPIVKMPDAQPTRAEFQKTIPARSCRIER
jgi:hypothetical protein